MNKRKLQTVINLINARIDKHEKEARNICKHTDGITESDDYEVHELEVMIYEAKEIIKEVKMLQGDKKMNNIIKGIKLIISGLLSPFKIITDKLYNVSLLEKIDELQAEDKALKRDIIALDKYLYKSIDDLKEDINDKSSRITETANDLVDLIVKVDKIDKCVGQMDNHHREVFETHLSKIAENRDNVSDLKDRINDVDVKFERLTKHYKEIGDKSKKEIYRVEDRVVNLIKGLELRVAELERNQNKL